MTKILKRLQDRGFIYRKEDLNDKRCMLVCLSEDGEAIIKKSLYEISKECHKYFETLGKEEKELFSSLLKKILININKVE